MLMVWKNEYVKMFILLKVIYVFNAILTEIPGALFTKKKKIEPRIQWNHRDPE